MSRKNTETTVRVPQEWRDLPQDLRNRLARLLDDAADMMWPRDKREAQRDGR